MTTRTSMFDPEMCRQLQIFADDLDHSHFRALSHGLGMGRPRVGKGPATRPAAASTLAQQVAAETAAHRPLQPTPQSGQTEVRRPINVADQRTLVHEMRASQQMPPAMHPASGPQPRPLTGAHALKLRQSRQRQARQAFGWDRRMLAWSFDFTIVAATALIMAACIGMVYRLPVNLEAGLLPLGPLRWLYGVKTLHMIVAVYSLFFGYLAMFYLIAGRTLGEVILGKPSHNLVNN